MCHEWRHIKRLNFPNLIFRICIWLRLLELVLEHILVFKFLLTYCKTHIKLAKLFKIWDNSKHPTSFFNFGWIKWFCPKVPNVGEFHAIELSTILSSAYIIYFRKFQKLCSILGETGNIYFNIWIKISKWELKCFWMKFVIAYWI